MIERRLQNAVARGADPCRLRRGDARSLLIRFSSERFGLRCRFLAMSKELPIGEQVLLPGHFDGPVTLEAARALTSGFECRVRLPDGTLEEAVLSEKEAAALGFSRDWHDSVESAEAQRRIHESGRTGKRQGTKCPVESAMSSLVVMRKVVPRGWLVTPLLQRLRGDRINAKRRRESSRALLPFWKSTT